MKPTLLLRIAALISAGFAAGHLLGGLQQWNPFGGNPVFALMAGRRFDLSGTGRSYLDLYLGLGWTVQVLLLLQAVVLWQMASLARSGAARLRPMIASFAIAAAATALVSWRYILPPPALFGAVLFVVLVLAWVAAGREEVSRA